MRRGARLALVLPAAGVVSLSFFRYDVFMLPVLGAICCAPPLVLAALVQGGRGRGSGARSLAFLSLLLVATAVGSVIGYRTLLSSMEREAKPVIEALAAHHQAQGAYPETLDELVPAQLPALPELVTEHATKRSFFGDRLRYHSAKDRASFSLTITTYGFNHHTYEPGRGWYDWD